MQSFKRMSLFSVVPIRDVLFIGLFFFSPFSQYVKSNSAGSGCNLSVDEVFQSEKLINDSIRIGGNQLKLTIRRLNLHPAHPVRKTLWSRLISAKYSVSLPVSHCWFYIFLIFMN